MPRFKYNLEERSPFEKVLAIDKGATLPSLEIQVLDGNDPVDLTAATVTFSMQDANGVPKISGAAANLDDAATGKVSYDWAGADVDTDGNFSGQFSIVVAAGTYKIPNGSTQRLIVQIGRVTLAGLPTADGLVALHSASHILGGLDELDADRVGIDVTLPNITPDTVPAEVSSVKHLGAILKGISDALATIGAAHAASHQDGGSDEISVAALSGLLADSQDPIAHIVRHIVGGSDPFLATQLIDAICRRLRTTTGPTDLLLGAIADGEFLKRDGSAIVGGAASFDGDMGGNALTNVANITPITNQTEVIGALTNAFLDVISRRLTAPTGNSLIIRLGTSTKIEIDSNKIELLHDLQLRNQTVAALGGFFTGQIAFATNGRKIGEGAGSGTGVLVYRSADGNWYRASDDTIVAA